MGITVATSNAIVTARVGQPLYLALLTLYPAWTDTGNSITEPTAVDYSRHYLDPAYWGAPSAGVSTWNFDISYAPVNNWGTIIAYGLCSADTAGSLEAYEYLSSPVTLSAFSTFRIASGMLSYGAM
jgi:hypothetical protein